MGQKEIEEILKQHKAISYKVNSLTSLREWRYLQFCYNTTNMLLVVPTTQVWKDNWDDVFGV